jgi:hypothetical protein
LFELDDVMAGIRIQCKKNLPGEPYVRNVACILGEAYCLIQRNNVLGGFYESA